MKTTHTKPLSVIGPAILLALFAAGGLAARALALPVPPYLAGLALVALALRVGVMFAALHEAPDAAARPVGPRANARGHAIEAAHG